MALTASGCRTHHPEFTAGVPRSVAVLGVVQREGLNVPINEYRLARDLETLLREQYRHSVMPIQQVRIALGGQRHDMLLRRFSRSGVLYDSDLLMLNRANLPTRMAVLLTMASNDVENLPEERLRLRDAQGRVMADREHQILATKRSVSMTATLVNLGSKQVRLRDTFTYQAVERKRFVHYSGSSFSGSVAASVVNKLSNGGSQPKWPAPPGVYGSFYELLNEVAKQLPIA